MPITNKEISDKLKEIANALEEQDENPYRTRAYRRAANVIVNYPDNIYKMVMKEIDLTLIPYIGKKLRDIIIKIVKGDDDIMPKSRPAMPYPEKWQNKSRKMNSYKIYSVYFIIEKILEELRGNSHVKKVEPTGDYRRKKEVVTDFNILVLTDHPTNVFELFHTFSSVKYLIETTQHYTIVQLKIGIRLTLRVVDKKNWGIKLLYFTGSNEHFEGLKQIGEYQHLELNAFQENVTNVNYSTEEQIYKKLKLEYIPPELRENRGEIEVSKKYQLPNLITLNDIKGDLHCHTNETDGFFSLEEMANAAKSHGYQYVAITDHSKSLKITNGMDEKRLLKQMELIDKLNEKFFDFKILKSMEVDILEDGSLDLSNEVLKQLDLTVCSVHSKFRLSLQKQTERIIRAMDNPYFNILGHATGRLIKHRPPYEIDIDRILYAAKERKCFIEVNAQPARLDINDIYCKKAKDIGVKIAISSDAHTTNGFNFMILGINQARRGWLEASDVINTYSLKNLKAILKK